jgi:hypothetical protein
VITSDDRDYRMAVRRANDPWEGLRGVIEGRPQVDSRRRGECVGSAPSSAFVMQRFPGRRTSLEARLAQAGGTAILLK